MKSVQPSDRFLIFWLVSGFFVSDFGKFPDFTQNLALKWPKQAKKSKIQKSVTWLHRFHIGAPSGQFWGQMDQPVAQTSDWC